MSVPPNEQTRQTRPTRDVAELIFPYGTPVQGVCWLNRHGTDKADTPPGPIPSESRHEAQDSSRAKASLVCSYLLPVCSGSRHEAPGNSRAKARFVCVVCSVCRVQA